VANCQLGAEICYICNTCTAAAGRAALSECSAPARPAAADCKPGIGVDGSIFDAAFTASAGADWSAECKSSSAASPKPRRPPRDEVVSAACDAAAWRGLDISVSASVCGRVGGVGGRPIGGSAGRGRGGSR